MNRKPIDYLIISMKGIAMGAADAVPGVSGGTIALIAGIYQELIATISNIKLSLITTLRQEGFKAAWKALNGNFLVALVTGILISFVSFMRLAKYLIEKHPILIWSFFFGLIIASIYYVGKQVNQWRTNTFAALLIGTAVAFYISTLPSLASSTNQFFLFFAGAIAICAMILPGISGSFILVILGAYKTLSDAIHDFDFKKLAVFVLGAVVGLLSFSRVLKWLFKHYYNLTMALLTGFIVGSLNKIWPWKLTQTVIEKETGTVMPLSDLTPLNTLNLYQQTINNFETYKIVTEKSILPFEYYAVNDGANPYLFPAIGLMFLGFSTIFLLEKLGSKQVQ
ncbi:membrane protein [Mangrovimonas yunxiaonensis]|uniref:Membrane protein n=1 Tax=Mangrovimonas yunxiaonensis TaxID=1197477 RepID=A0A084TIN5_9FLAO|nr:DUF368 domain-containing protein [Mangrovimonas yunxiaonensis]KFB00571.1 membrane protein [Mangrovimonas yunxiaonensis]GGH47073.1 DUF368 domain-containing protein [Mangrovimonas yunxiaonensis]